MCDIKSIITLGITSEMSYTDIFNLITPFANEIANVITVAGVYKLYSHEPKTTDEKIQVLILDFVALVGLCSNVATYTKKYNLNVGLAKGILLVIFSYLIPNFFMYNFLKRFEPRQRLAIGLVLVYCLELYISSILCLTKKFLYLKKKEDDEKNH